MPTVVSIPQVAEPAYPAVDTAFATTLFETYPSDPEESDGTETRLPTIDITLGGGETFADPAVIAAATAAIDAAFPQAAGQSVVWGSRPRVTLVSATRALITGTAKVVDDSTRTNYVAVNSLSYTAVDGTAQSATDVYVKQGMLDGAGVDLYAQASGQSSPVFFTSAAAAEASNATDGPYTRLVL